jgi:peptide/nickel transport system permease protein
MGLNEPLYMQFCPWMSQLLCGDLGTSIFSGLPVTELIV